MKTTFTKDEQSVCVDECYKFIKGKLHNFVIKESDQYFISEKRAIRAANDLLLRKTLPESRYAEKRADKKRRIGANKIQHVYECYVDTLLYVKRWDGIIYLETKKRLLAELQQKLNTLYVLYKFKGIKEVNGFIKRRTK